MRQPFLKLLSVFVCLLIIQFYPGLPFAAKQSTGEIFRSIFTSNISDRQPVDDLENITTETETVYYFTELRGMNGQTVTHQWIYNGNVVAVKAFQVKGNRDRIYSNKTLTPQDLGPWTVKVLDSGGNVLKQDNFVYEKAFVPEILPDTAKSVETGPVHQAVNPYIVQPAVIDPDTTMPAPEPEEAVAEELPAAPQILIPGKTPPVATSGQSANQDSADAKMTDSGSDLLAANNSDSADIQTAPPKPLIPGKTPPVVQIEKQEPQTPAVAPVSTISMQEKDTLLSDIVDNTAIDSQSGILEPDEEMPDTSEESKNEGQATEPVVAEHMAESVEQDAGPVIGSTETPAEIPRFAAADAAPIATLNGEPESPEKMTVTGEESNGTDSNRETVKPAETDMESGTPQPLGPEKKPPIVVPAIPDTKNLESTDKEDDKSPAVRYRVSKPLMPGTKPPVDRPSGKKSAADGSLPALAQPEKSSIQQQKPAAAEPPETYDPFIKTTTAEFASDRKVKRVTSFRGPSQKERPDTYFAKNATSESTQLTQDRTEVPEKKTEPPVESKPQTPDNSLIAQNEPQTTKDANDREAQESVIPPAHVQTGPELSEPPPENPPVPRKKEGVVVRAVISNGISNYEPIDDVTSIQRVKDKKIYFFNEIHGMLGKTISHKWIYQGDEKATVPIKVKGDPYRAYTSKTMMTIWLGNWTVQVLDEEGNILKEVYFEYVE